MDTPINIRKMKVAFCTGTDCPLRLTCKRFSLAAFGNAEGKYWMSPKYDTDKDTCPNRVFKKYQPKSIDDEQTECL